MTVMAKPNLQFFVVSEKDKSAFEKERTPKSEWQDIMKMSKDFDKYNLKIKQ